MLVVAAAVVAHLLLAGSLRPDLAMDLTKTLITSVEHHYSSLVVE